MVKHNRNARGYGSWCKLCHTRRRTAYDSLTRRKEYLHRTYGLAPDEYDMMLTTQRGLCAICEETPPPAMAGRNRKIVTTLHVDHCHTSNKVRALLCQNCNVAIGALRERIDLLPKVEAYLRLHAIKDVI